MHLAVKLYKFLSKGEFHPTKLVVKIMMGMLSLFFPIYIYIGLGRRLLPVDCCLNIQKTNKNKTHTQKHTWSPMFKKKPVG